MIIEAIQWTGYNIDEITEFIDFDRLPDLDDGNVGSGIGYVPAFGTIDVPTLEGIMTANIGDWIICGTHGEYYPCKDQIFKEIYEEVL